MDAVISNQSCQAFVRALPDAALIVNRSQTILAANALAREILSAELDGQPMTMFLRSPDFLNALSETLSSSTNQQIDLVVRSRVQRALDVHISPLGPGETGSVVLVVIRDRTREEQIERMRSDFVANASHELRTPLTTISGFIETMQGAAAKDEQARIQFLKLMKAQAERMSQLIDDLLSLSRIELDEHVAPHAIVNLSDVVRQTHNLLQTLVLETGCTLTVDLPKQILVRGDANQLAQVVHNLIENAVRYAGKGKSVFIHGAVENRLALLSVKDNGPGIAAHHLPRLTERFYRVNVQDSRTRGGTGLGLAICKHIINRHRGKLLIESVVGQGSTFAIQLPVSE